MDRSLLHSQSEIRIFDVASQFKDILTAFGDLAADLYGATDTVVTEFDATAQVPASLNINLGAGRIYQLAAIDEEDYGSEPADSTVIFQQGKAPAQTLTFNTSGLSSGQSKWGMVVARFTQPDSVRPGDPTNGVLAFYNSANPAQPLQGPGGTGAVLMTLRKGFAEISIIYGNAATTGSHVPPVVPSGYVPLYLVSLAFGQSAITSGQILVSGADAHEDAPEAPFAGGLYSHRHNGLPGQADKINPATDLDGIVPFENLLLTSEYTTEDYPARIPTIRDGLVDPNGVIDGGKDDLYFQSNAGVTWVCTTASTDEGELDAVWTPSGPVAPVVVSAFPANITQTSGKIALTMSAAGAINLPSTDLAWELEFIRTDSNDTVLGTLTAAGGEAFVGGSTTKTINAGDVVRLCSLVGQDKILVLSEFKGGT